MSERRHYLRDCEPVADVVRVYSTRGDLPRVLGGYGIASVSTSQGILTDVECRKRGIGGEVMCEIW